LIENIAVQTPKFGAHMSVAGGYDKAVRAASIIGFPTVQLFTKNNNQWKAPPISETQIREFRDALAQTKVTGPVAHTSYLINLASPSDALWNQSVDAMTVEVERCQALGVLDLVLHPGAHMGSGEETGLQRAAAALDEVRRRTRGADVTIDLETTAGQGTCLGHRFEHLARLFELASQPERLGVCVDTCHIFAAGYSFATGDEYDELIAELDRTIGLGRVRVWHLNDSLRECGSRVDRHAGIGLGRIGLEPFRHVVNDPRFERVPMILETPKGMVDGEDLDAIHLRTLRGLINSKGGRPRRKPGARRSR
jgi:deoxyribonuclease-4